MGGGRTSFEYGRLGGTSDFRVLVADDDAASRRLLEAVFGSCGCVVTLALDGGEAAELALGRDFDLVCLDRHMPFLTGDEVADRLHALGDGARPYLAACTSDGDEPADGFDAVLIKPIRLQSVIDTIAGALQFRRAARGGAKLIAA
jgi:CheY-like chemotaxis protein